MYICIYTCIRSTHRLRLERWKRPQRPLHMAAQGLLYTRTNKYLYIHIYTTRHATHTCMYIDLWLTHALPAESRTSAPAAQPACGTKCGAVLRLPKICSCRSLVPRFFSLPRYVYIYILYVYTPIYVNYIDLYKCIFNSLVVSPLFMHICIFIYSPIYIYT